MASNDTGSLNRPHLVDTSTAPHAPMDGTGETTEGLKHQARATGASGPWGAGVGEALSTGALSVEALAVEVVAEWERSGVFSEQTLARCGETVLRFARRLRAQGISRIEEVTLEHCRGFVDAVTTKGAAPELTTRHVRRTSLRMFFRTLRELDHPVGDPTLDLKLPVRGGTTARPLDDAEVMLCRTSTRLGEAGSASLQRAVCWALAEATAVTSEISAVRVGDVDDFTTPRWVRLPGTRRHDPRLGELTDWGSTIVARHLAHLTREGAATNPATLLTYRGHGTPGQAAAQAAACNAVGAVLELAGLATERDVRPASVRNWAGRRLYDAGMPIEHVARRLGARTLDSTATDIALVWRPAT